MSAIVGMAEGYILPRVRFAGDDVVSMVVKVTEVCILSTVRRGEGGVVSMTVGVVERVKIVNMLAEVAEVVSGLLYVLCLYI